MFIAMLRSASCAPIIGRTSAKKGAAVTDMRIGAAATDLAAITARVMSGGGSPAQQAYERAVKQLAKAQKQLAQDVANGAPEEAVKVGRAMVEMAAAAVEAAAAALAREQE